MFAKKWKQKIARKKPASSYRTQQRRQRRRQWRRQSAPSTVVIKCCASQLPICHLKIKFRLIYKGHTASGLESPLGPLPKATSMRDSNAIYNYAKQAGPSLFAMALWTLFHLPFFSLSLGHLLVGSFSQLVIYLSSYGVYQARGVRNVSLFFPFYFAFRLHCGRQKTPQQLQK